MNKVRTYWTGPQMDSESYEIIPQDADRIGLSVNDLEVEIDLTSLELIIRDSSTLDEFLRFDCKIIEGVHE
jgi:hypothetical protein